MRPINVAISPRNWAAREFAVTIATIGSAKIATTTRMSRKVSDSIGLGWRNYIPVRVSAGQDPKKPVECPKSTASSPAPQIQSEPRPRRLPRQVPHAQRQGDRAKPISQQSRFSVMNLPALPEGNGGSNKHHDASNRIQVCILSPPEDQAPADQATTA